jgi:hypothetical protein
LHKTQAGVETLPNAAAPEDAFAIVHPFLLVMAAFLPSGEPVQAKANK